MRALLQLMSGTHLCPRATAWCGPHLCFMRHLPVLDAAPTCVRAPQLYAALLAGGGKERHFLGALWV